MSDKTVTVILRKEGKIKPIRIEGQYAEKLGAIIKYDGSLYTYTSFSNGEARYLEFIGEPCEVGDGSRKEPEGDERDVYAVTYNGSVCCVFEDEKRANRFIKRRTDNKVAGWGLSKVPFNEGDGLGGK